MLAPKEKFSLPEKFSEEDQTHDAASSRTASQTHCQRAISAPSHITDTGSTSPISDPIMPGRMAT